MHHVAIRTADIHRAIAFYEALGFTVTERFTAGMTLACWMEGWQGRLELMQVPNPLPPPDPFADEGYVGYYHLSLDLSTAPTPAGDDLESRDPSVPLGLPQWLAAFQSRIRAAHPGDTALELPKVLLAPCQQMIGSRVYEVAFIADPDGMPIEILSQLTPN
ncbi:MAG: VOC family protein [Cyanobacteria bacterium P01_H01_bin.130]